jgi:hypothetical protein
MFISGCEFWTLKLICTAVVFKEKTATILTEDYETLILTNAGTPPSPVVVSPPASVWLVHCKLT